MGKNINTFHKQSFSVVLSRNIFRGTFIKLQELSWLSTRLSFLMQYQNLYYYLVFLMNYKLLSTLYNLIYRCPKCIMVYLGRKEILLKKWFWNIRNKKQGGCERRKEGERESYEQGLDFEDMSSFFPCEIDDAIQYINLGYGAQAPKIVFFPVILCCF